MKLTKFLLILCPLVLTVGLLSGCNTVKGAGQDISDTGQTISHVASEATPK
jgi:predicted small secreted protein